MYNFVPNYKNIVQAARNIKPERMPLYEHIISDEIMEKVMNKKFSQLAYGNTDEKREYIRNYVDFYKYMGYDTVSFERLITSVMPGSGALYGHNEGIIKNRDDYDRYPWYAIADEFFIRYSEFYSLLHEEMPQGMKAVGGPGNGVFECVQDIVGYTNLCYISVDDRKLYCDLFKKVGDVLYKIWVKFLEEFGDIYCVCRFGDDLGFRSSTLISPEDIKENVIPQNKRIIELVHSYDKPFLLHSCGNIFDVMDDIINIAEIDAKHSNEDAIAPFNEWVERYGSRIGNFGGVDTDVLCQKNEQEIKEYVRRVIKNSIDHGGFALGSGNSIPDYIPVNGYIAMIEAAREARGESRP